MSQIDQARAYLSLRERMAQIRAEFGQDQGWQIIEQAVVANITDDGYHIQRLSNSQAIHALRLQKSGEIA
jgi:hypothetical protein